MNCRYCIELCFTKITKGTTSNIISLQRLTLDLVDRLERHCFASHIIKLLKAVKLCVHTSVSLCVPLTLAHLAAVDCSQGNTTMFSNSMWHVLGPGVTIAGTLLMCGQLCHAVVAATVHQCCYGRRLPVPRPLWVWTF